MKQKKKLTRQEEFQILTLVLDKFLWAGLLIMLFGLYISLVGTSLNIGLWIMAGGAVVLLLLMTLLLREFEVAE